MNIDLDQGESCNQEAAIALLALWQTPETPFEAGFFLVSEAPGASPIAINESGLENNNLQIAESG